MSLTSYRAAPPRGKAVAEIVNRRVLDQDPLGRPGDDLLSRALRRSTIGPEELNDRVRDGIGWGLLGIVTRSTKRIWFREDISVCKALHELY
jgi:hypothetical protein